jgi:hypothetical protein
VGVITVADDDDAVADVDIVGTVGDRRGGGKASLPGEAGA